MCCRCVSRVTACAAVVGLVCVVFTPAFGQGRVSRSIDGPVTAEKVSRALVLVPTPRAIPTGRPKSDLACGCSFSSIPRR